MTTDTHRHLRITESDCCVHRYSRTANPEQEVRDYIRLMLVWEGFDFGRPIARTRVVGYELIYSQAI